MDMDSAPKIPIEQFLPNSPFSRVLERCSISTPSRFLEMTQSFLVSVCNFLIGHPVKKSELLRGLSSFDPAVLLHSNQTVYESSINYLVNRFLAAGWVTSEKYEVTVSEYRSLVIKFRQEKFDIPDDIVSFFSNHWDLLARPHLYHVFQLTCLCLKTDHPTAAKLTHSIPGISMPSIRFDSIVHSIQTSIDYLSDPVEFYGSDDCSLGVTRVFGEGKRAYRNKKFSGWENIEVRKRSSIRDRLTETHQSFTVVTLNDRSLQKKKRKRGDGSSTVGNAEKHNSSGGSTTSTHSKRRQVFK